MSPPPLDAASAAWDLTWAIATAALSAGGTAYGAVVRNAVIVHQLGPKAAPVLGPLPHDDVEVCLPSLPALARFLNGLRQRGLEVASHEQSSVDCDLQRVRYTVQPRPPDVRAALRGGIAPGLRALAGVQAAVAACHQSVLQAVCDAEAVVVVVDAHVRQANTDREDTCNNTNIRNAPPFHAIDFECNGLILTRAHGLQLCAALRGPDPFAAPAHLNKVLSDVHARRAVAVNGGASPLRGARLTRRGFTLHGRAIEQARGPYEGHCLMCHDAVPALHWKMKCCDARYHGVCLLRTVGGEWDRERDSRGHPSCPMCRAPCGARALRADLASLLGVPVK